MLMTELQRLNFLYNIKFNLSCFLNPQHSLIHVQSSLQEVGYAGKQTDDIIQDMKNFCVSNYAMMTKTILLYRDTVKFITSHCSTF